MKTVKIIHHVEINFFFFSVEIFKIETFQSRLCRVKIFVKIVEICRDLLRHRRDLSRCSRDLSRNLDKKIQKSMHFSIEIETNCWETPKFSDLDEFLDLDWDFLWTLMLRRNQEFSISIEISRLRLTFLKCRDKFFEMLRSRVLIKTTSRQIETPRLNTISSPLTSCICLFMCSLAGNKN